MLVCLGKNFGCSRWVGAGGDGVWGLEVGVPFDRPVAKTLAASFNYLPFSD